MGKIALSGLLSLNPNTLLSSLIGAGDDASPNLYIVNFMFKDSDKNPSVRATRVSVPKKENRSVVVPFQNMEFPILSPGASVDRTVSVDLRMDSLYENLELFESHLCVDDNGYFQRDDNKAFTCIVTAYRGSSNQFTAVNSYEFSDCFLLSIPSLTYSYESQSAMSVNLTFMFSTYEHLTSKKVHTSYKRK